MRQRYLLCGVSLCLLESAYLADNGGGAIEYTEMTGTGNGFWEDFGASTHYGRHHTVFTAEYFERVLQSVFHTITIVAVYEIVKETYRRIELIRLRCRVRRYEALAQACCLQIYGCRACKCCTQLNFPTITYRAVPTSIYRAMDGRTRLWRKHPSGSPHYTVANCRHCCSTQDEIACLNRYIRELNMYVQELRSAQDFQMKERYRRDALRRKQMEQELMLMILREKNLCACGIDLRPNEPSRVSSPSQSRPQSCNRPLRIC